MKQSQKKVCLCVCAAACLVIAGCAHKINFSSGSFKSNETSIALTVTEGETQLLNDFDDLQSVDLTGSTNYGEIRSWAAANPDVTVTYAVFLPDGTQADPNTAYLDVTDMGSGDVPALKAALANFPYLQTVELGSNEGSFTIEDAKELQAAFPNINFNYNLLIDGTVYGFDTTEVNLKTLDSSQVAAAAEVLADLPNVQKLYVTCSEVGGTLSLDEITVLANACPNAVIDCPMDVYGEQVNFADDSLIISHITLEDNGALVWKVLPLMRNCTLLDMDSCGVGNEDMAAIRDAFPNVKVVWRIWWGWLYSVRTDVETVCCSNPYKGGFLTKEASQPMIYLTNLVNLDAGHDEELKDIYFLEYMPRLEILILYGAMFKDASPIGTLKNLTYLEIADNWEISDISPLGNCTKLRDLNIASCPKVTDMSALYNCTELERLWIGCYTPIPEAQIQKIQEICPGIEMDLKVDNPVLGKWRYESTGGPNGDVLTEKYAHIREVFGYSWDIEEDDSFYAYWYNDPQYYHRLDTNTESETQGGTTNG